MPLPALIEGGVLPPGIHDCVLSEVREMFGEQSGRSQLMDRFEAFLERLSDTIVFPVSIYLDGSFITDWQCCRDIDVVIEAREFEGERVSLLTMLTAPQVRDEFSEDFSVKIHVVVPGLFAKDYRAWFQNVKTEDSWRFGMEPSLLKKGIVRLVL